MLKCHTVGSSLFGEMPYSEPPEGYPKVGTVKRINKWIYGAINPAKPS